MMNSKVRTFLIADVRGYTRFTEEHGDEQAERLAAKFAQVTHEAVELRDGEVVEVRGDEALVVFDSARQALRAALDVQARFAEETEADPRLPLRVGIGLDSGEAVTTQGGGFRGAALNTAARLCALAGGGDVIASEGTLHLAGRVEGVQYVDRGRVNLKGVSQTVHIFRVQPEGTATTSNNWFLTVLAPVRAGALGWKAVLAVCLIAAATAAGVVWATTRGPSAEGRSTNTAHVTAGASGGMTMTGTMTSTESQTGMTPQEQLQMYASDHSWQCSTANALPKLAQASMVCDIDVRGYPLALQLSLFKNGQALERAYKAALAKSRIPAKSGKCTNTSWGGEVEWLHGEGEPGGRAFCYLSGGRSYVTWTSEAGKKLLGSARLDTLQHRHLSAWWLAVRHDVV
jgi:class 3 adenylate cyclase